MPKRWHEFQPGFRQNMQTYDCYKETASNTRNEQKQQTEASAQSLSLTFVPFEQCYHINYPVLSKLPKQA